MNFFKKIITGFKKVVVPATLLAVVVMPALALATEPSASTTPDNSEILQEFTQMITVILGFLQYLLYPILMVIAALMDNELLFSPSMESRLLQIWVEVRNWVNIFFVLILVFIAMYNVLGIGGDGDNYALKAILPKIVIGLIAVNFSFLAGKLLIDSVGVVTNAVYALPSSNNNSLVDWDEQKAGMTLKLCKDPSGNVRAKSTLSMLGAFFCEMDASAQNTTGELNNFGKNFFSHFGSQNVAMVMMVQLGNVTDLGIVADMEINTLTSITFEILFEIFMFILFGFAYVALVVVLLARVVVLWIGLALSPIAVLLIIFPDLASAGGGELDLKGQFIKHLFVPLVIGVVFSIGFIMLATLQGASTGGILGAIGGLSLENISDSDGVQQAAIAYGSNLSNFQNLLIAVATVVIIWVGVFAAASQTVAQGVVSTIKGAGESAAKFVGKLPAYATVLPVKIGGEAVSPMNILGLITGAVREFDSKQNAKKNRMLDSLFKPSGLRQHQQRLDGAINSTEDKNSEGPKIFAAGLQYKVVWDDFSTVKKNASELAGRLSLPGLKTKIDGAKTADELKALLVSSEADAMFGENTPVSRRQSFNTLGGEPPIEGADAGKVPDAKPDPKQVVESVVEVLNANGTPFAGTLDKATHPTQEKAVLDILSDKEISTSSIMKEGVFDDRNQAVPVGNAIDAFRGATEAQREAILEKTECRSGTVGATSFVQSVTDVLKTGTTATTRNPAAPAVLPSEEEDGSTAAMQEPPFKEDPTLPPEESVEEVDKMA